MRVVATAGHVDHGKSTLLEALTGEDPDRWAEEKRRGLTIDLGFVSMPLADGEPLAFVDVPGHRRYLANTVAGVATAPAVLFVVAADEGWMPQSDEHLAAVDAFGIRHVLVTVTKIDLADPAAASAQALDRLGRRGLGNVPVVPVSANTGEGLPNLRQALDDVTGRIAPPDGAAPVRLWIDRAFTVAGAGTVVTGTLTAGSLSLDSPVELSPSGEQVSIRGIHCLGRPATQVTAPARVAVNLRRVSAGDVGRGHALIEPERWWRTGLVDVRLPHEHPTPSEVIVHCGTAAIAARVRRLGDDIARLTLARPTHLHNGDRLLVRDTGRATLLAAVVLDVDPPPLRGRGAAAARAREAATGNQLRRRGIARRRDLIAMGEAAIVDAGGEWLIDPQHHRHLAERLAELVDRHARDHPVDPGMPLAVAQRALGLPTPALVAALTGTLAVRGGRLYRADAADRVPDAVARAARSFRDAVAGSPFRSPTRPQLADRGLTPAVLARAVAAGLLLRVDEVHLLPDAPQRAIEALRRIPEPFSVSQACRALATTRRVAIPLLEHLDRIGATRRQADGRRRVTGQTET